MGKPKINLLVLTIVAAACAISLAGRGAMALKAGAGGTSGGPCMESFYECLRGCGPTPGSNPACEKYCEEQVLAKCKGPAAAKGRVTTPGAVKGGVKEQ
jgi:hypothetical protein